MLRVEARIDRAQAHEAFDEQPGPNQQHQRQGHLRLNQHLGKSHRHAQFIPGLGGARRWYATRQSGAFAGWRPNRGWDDHIFATRLFSYTFRLCLERQPRELGEFVIVHELVHLLAPNHGKVFN